MDVVLTTSQTLAGLFLQTDVVLGTPPSISEGTLPGGLVVFLHPCAARLGNEGFIGLVHLFPFPAGHT